MAGWIQGVRWGRPDRVAFVVAGRNGYLATSHNGRTWISRVSGFGGSTVRGVCWSEGLGLFAAVGDGGTIATSPDGETWTAQSSPVASALHAVKWAAGIGKFVAVGASGQVVTSSDGVTWTAATKFGANTGFGVAWSPSLGLLAAVVSIFRIYTSPDAVTWTERVSPFGVNVNKIAWNGALGRFHAVGSAAGVGQHVFSTNGTTWTSYATPPSDPSVASAGFESDEAALVATGGGNNTIDTSPDGSTWTATDPGSMTIITGLVRSDPLDLFLAAGYSSAGPRRYIFTAPDGLTWTQRLNELNADAIECACAVNP